MFRLTFPSPEEYLRGVRMAVSVIRRGIIVDKATLALAVPIEDWAAVGDALDAAQIPYIEAAIPDEEYSVA